MQRAIPRTSHHARLTFTHWNVKLQVPSFWIYRHTSSQAIFESMDESLFAADEGAIKKPTKTREELWSYYLYLKENRVGPDQILMPINPIWVDWC
ncbi:hypothetical protein WAI453_004973 [Rhynchosporium graminicola]